MLHLRNNTLAILVVVCVFMGGCASFSACQLPQRSILSYTNRIEKDNLVVAAESFYVPEKSIAYFDLDLTTRFVVPIFFVITNKSSDRDYAIEAALFRLKADNINTELTPMTEGEITKKVRRGTFWRTLGWCCIVPIVTIPIAAIGSTMHTSNVNSKAVCDAKNKNLTGQAVGPNDTLRGIVFFDVAKYKARKLINPVVKAVFNSIDNSKIEVEIGLQK